jgi:hypothetical protein
MEAPPFVVVRVQPMAGELSRYTVTSSDPNDEGEEDIVQTGRVPSRIVQTSMSLPWTSDLVLTMFQFINLDCLSFVRETTRCRPRQMQVHVLGQPFLIWMPSLGISSIPALVHLWATFSVAPLMDTDVLNLQQAGRQCIRKRQPRGIAALRSSPIARTPPRQQPQLYR